MNELVRRYGNQGAPGPSMYEETPEGPGFWSETAANWRRGWGPQATRHMLQKLQKPDPNFNPYDGLGGYEQYAERMLAARSAREQELIKQQIDANRRDDELIAKGEWGILSGLAAGIGDPLNLVPVPGAMGIGFVRGALRTGVATGALTAGSEVVRLQADPTMHPDEMVYSIGLSALLGGILGGAAGSFGSKSARFGDWRVSAKEVDRALNDIEQGNSIYFQAQEEGVVPVYGKTRSYLDNGDGTRSYERVVIRDELGAYEPIKASDGRWYSFDPNASRGGWIVANDAGRENPRLAPNEISKELTAATQESGPPRKVERRIVVDEAAIKRDYENGNWMSDLDPETAGELAANINHVNDYVAYKQIDALWKHANPRRDGESLPDYRKRAVDAAVKEIKGRKASFGYGKAKIGPFDITKLVERLNFSPIAKAIRIFPEDNILANTMLKIGGDYGWAVEANAYGMRTPPSLIMRSMRHMNRYAEFRQTFDKAWNSYVTKQTTTEGAQFQGMNISSAVNSARQQFKKMAGQKVMTRQDFKEIVGRAVFEKGDFEHNGFPVPEEARQVAKEFSSMMEEYEARLREAGVFDDIKGAKKRLKDAHDAYADVKDQTVSMTDNTQQRAIRVPEWAAARGLRGRNRGGPRTASEIDNLNTNLNDEEMRILQELDQLDEKQAQLSGWITQAPEDWWKLWKVIKDHPEYTTLIYDRMGFQSEKMLEDFQQVADHFFGKDRIRVTGGDDVEERTMGGWFNSEENRIHVNFFANFLAAAADTLALGGKMDYPADLLPKKFLEDYAKNRVEDVFIHETLHGFRQMGGFRPSEWNILRKAADDLGWMEKHAIPARYNQHYTDWGLSKAGRDDLLYEEAIAEAFTEWVAKGRPSGKDPHITLFDRMWNYITETISAMLGRGEPRWQSWEEIFKAMSSGQMREFLNENKPFWLNEFNGTTSRTMHRMKTIKDEDIITGSNYDEIYDEILERWGDEDGHKILEELGWQDKGYMDPQASYKDASTGQIRRGIGFSNEPATMWDDFAQRYGEPAMQRRKALHDRLLEDIRVSRETLDNATDLAHQFTDMEGNPEGYFPRYFNTSKIAAERERFIRLLTRIYERDNAAGARQRAEDTTARILGEMQEPADPGKSGGSRSSHSRVIKVGNSFTMTDRELGEISLHEFMDTDVLSIGESYMRQAGTLIEASDMFGDAALYKEEVRLRAYLESRYHDQPEKIEEAMGFFDLSRRAVLGRLRERDPWAWDNRTARDLKNGIVLATMGRVMLTSVPEAIRPFMINGFGTGFRATFARLFSDLENIIPNSEYGKLSGELVDMVMSNENARVIHNQLNEQAPGGTWFEKLLQDAVPGYFKLVGLTPWTHFMKDITMFAAQHRVMDLAAKGARGDAEASRILGALGMNTRDIQLLAKMPVQINEGGKLILPAVQNWTGVDGRRAKLLLLDAVHAEARRAIVTPSLGDKSLLFQGVWQQGGQKKFESDLMTLPMQFLSYGVAAHNKILVSALQGRDANVVGGMFMMLVGGALAAYLKAPENAWRNKQYRDILIEAYENAGFGGFWFGDVNQIIERMSGQQYGLRPLVGAKNRFGGDVSVADRIDLLGPGPSTVFDVSRAFWDPDLTATNRAQLIRRIVPYNNVLWWAGISRNLAQTTGEAFE